MVQGGGRAAPQILQELTAIMATWLVSRRLRPPPLSGLDLGASGGHPGTLPGLENEPPKRPGEPLWARNECFRVRKIMPPELRTGLPGAECCAYALKLVLYYAKSGRSPTKSQNKA